MGQLSANPGAADLTPELAAKLRQVERDVEVIEQQARRRSRWFWLGVIPRLAQACCVVALGWYAIATCLWMYVRVGSTIAPHTPIWVDVMGAVLRVAGTLVSLLIATWAYRYTVACGEGLLEPARR